MRPFDELGPELPVDDTAGRTEPEPVDVWADQAPADWTLEPRSDDLLSYHARRRLGMGWA